MTKVPYDYHLNESIGGFIESGHLLNFNRKCQIFDYGSLLKKGKGKTSFDSDRRPSEQISHWHTEKHKKKNSSEAAGK